MKEIEGIPLWLYTPQGKCYMNGHRRINTYHVHVVLAFKGYFHNINSKNVGIVTLAKRVEGARYDSAMAEAVDLRDNPNDFLIQLLGTSDKRTKKYKEFKVLCDQYKSLIMRKKLCQ
jgi:hypothetical protein